MISSSYLLSMICWAPSLASLIKSLTLLECLHSKMGVRKSDDYMKNYFVSQYGAIKDVDFSPLFQKLILGEKNQDGKKNNLEL